MDFTRYQVDDEVEIHRSCCNFSMHDHRHRNHTPMYRQKPHTNLPNPYGPLLVLHLETNPLSQYPPIHRISPTLYSLGSYEHSNGHVNTLVYPHQQSSQPPKDTFNSPSQSPPSPSPPSTPSTTHSSSPPCPHSKPSYQNNSHHPHCEKHIPPIIPKRHLVVRPPLIPLPAQSERKTLDVRDVDFVRGVGLEYAAAGERGDGGAERVDEGELREGGDVGGGGRW